MTPIRSLEGIRCGNGAAACARAHSRVVIGGSQVGQRLCTRVVDPHKKKKGAQTRLEFERVDADGDGTDHAGVEFLVVRLALGAPDVGQFPFEVWL